MVVRMQKEKPTKPTRRTAEQNRKRVKKKNCEKTANKISEKIYLGLHVPKALLMMLSFETCV